LLILCLSFLTINLIIWLLYLNRNQDIAFQRYTKDLRRPSALFVSVGLGHVFPLLLLFIMPGTNADEQILRFTISIAALGIITGAINQKAGIILIAGYLNGIMLPEDVSPNKKQGLHNRFVASSSGEKEFPMNLSKKHG
jgi:hypothetical protein